MSWPWIDSLAGSLSAEKLKNFSCKYLLQRYFGKFIEGKLTLDQLKTNFRNGTGSVTKVNINMESLNEVIGKEYQLPLQFISCSIEKLSIKIEWSSLLNKPSYVVVEGLRLIVQPQEGKEFESSTNDSVLMNLLNSSMHIAEEYLEEEPRDAGSSYPLQSIELFAKTIDSIFHNIQVKFVDTVIRLEHMPLGSMTGVGLELKIKNIDYFDESESDQNSSKLDPNTENVDPTTPSVDPNAQGVDPNQQSLSNDSILKKFCIEGVTMYIDEFPLKARTSKNRCSTPENFDEQYKTPEISPNQSVDNGEESNLKDSLTNEENAIIVAKFSGKQELKLQIKKGKATETKLELSAKLGSLASFLSPRQLHALITLVSGFTSPDLEDMSNLASANCREKPIIDSDLNRFYEEFSKNITAGEELHSKNLKHVKGWSTSSAYESEDVFVPIGATGATSMSESFNLNKNFSLDESIIASSTSSKSSVRNPPRSHKSRHRTSINPLVETSQFHIKMSSLVIVLPHKDILNCVEGEGLSNESLKQMQTAATNFFKKLEVLSSGDENDTNFEETSKLLVKACQLSHIQVLAELLMVDLSKNTTTQLFTISGSGSLTSLEVVECLVDSRLNDEECMTTEYVQLLAFLKEKSNLEFKNPKHFRIGFEYSKKAVRQGQITKFLQPKTTIDIQMEPCMSEIDVTIVDRISDILNPKLMFNSSSTPSAKEAKNFIDEVLENPMLSEFKTDIGISLSKCIVKLRFPITDYMTDMECVGWWKRYIRQDYITFKLTDTQIHSSMKSQVHYLVKNEVQCRRLLLTYTEAGSDVPIEIGRACENEKDKDFYQEHNKDFFWPRIVITINPKQLGGPLEEYFEVEAESGMNEILECVVDVRSDEPSPFSAKKVVHESNTPHSKSQNEEEKDNSKDRESEELILPGSREEMLKFMDIGNIGSRIQLEVCVPSASVQFPSKHVFELLYNRFNTDLFSWEPSNPKTRFKTDQHHNSSSSFLPDLTSFRNCNSRIHDESSTDFSDEEELFFSVQERQTKAKPSQVSRRGQSKLALTLNINQFLLSMYPPARDSRNNVIPEQQGELIFRFEDAIMFSVSAFKGDVNLEYVCGMVREAYLNHVGLTTRLTQTPPLRSVWSTIPSHCKPTIYKTEPGANIIKPSKEDMLSVAIRIKTTDETQKIKTLRIAVGVRNATLRHIMCASPNSWLSQLTDCFNVNDYSIFGHSPPAVLTEFYLHFWDCAIDYRPIYLPLKALVTLGNFSISSNITTETKSSTLRFIAEDFALFISNKFHKNQIMDLKRDYICVLDFGLFELCLKYNKDMSEGSPQVDLRSSNDCLNVKTCADSARALIDFISYFTGDGDMSPIINNSSNTSALGSDDERILIGDESSNNNFSKNHAELVQNLIGEAIEDIEEFSSEASNPSMACEVNLRKKKDTNHTNNIDETDYINDGFCMIEEEEGVGIFKNKDEGIEIRWLCQEQIRIIVNYFPVPKGEADPLQSPKEFPDPVSKYTVCDMNLNWQWYEGNDFVTTSENDQRLSATSQRSSPMDTYFNQLSPYEDRISNPRDSSQVQARGSPSDFYWLCGPGRKNKTMMELRLHKIRFQHEVYPEETYQSSRQILLIKEITINDRIDSSEIQTFLYQYTSKDIPKRTHGNMFEMRMLQVRSDPKISAQEVSLQISVLPIQLNMDQNSLNFLENFFMKMSNFSKQTQGNFNSSNNVQSNPGSKQGTPTHHPPIMSVNDSDPSSRTMDSSQESDMVDENLLIFLEDELRIKESKHNTKTVSEAQDDRQPLYFRSVVFSPEVIIKVDYKSRSQLNLSKGYMVGIFMALADFNKSEIRLKRLSYQHGLLGVDKLMNYLIQEWTQDIKSNQLGGLLKGIGPMSSFIQFFQGVRNLLLMPIQQYQKDGRVVRGLKQGANSFSSLSGIAVIELTSRLVRAVQSTAETAYDVVSSGPSVRLKSRKRKSRKIRFNQPTDIRAGMRNAYVVVQEGLDDTANQMIRVATEEHYHKGVSGVIGGVLRQIPATVVQPIIVMSEATNNVLDGLQAQLDSDTRR